MALARAAFLMRSSARRVPTALPATCVRGMAMTGEIVRRGGKARKPEDLLTVVKKELDYEKEEGEPVEALKEIAASFGEEWKLTDSTGSARFALTKSFGASHEVRVDVDCSPVPLDDEEPQEEEEAQNEEEEAPQGRDGYRVVITLTDKDKGRVLQAGAFAADGFRLHRVTHYTKGKEPSADQIFGGADDDATYAGPDFDELDSNLQTAFYEYLAERGVNDELAVKVADYAGNKEQGEYVGWLKNMKAFLE